MKVRCTDLRDARGNPVVRSPWLTIGHSYHVLSVILDAEGVWSVRVKGDAEPGVGLFPLAHFEVVSERLPSTWKALWRDRGVFELTPEAWSEPLFWERYFEHDAEARTVFEREASKIIREDP